MKTIMKEKINLNYNNKVPIYIQIYDALKRMIVNNEFKEGEKLPSETAFCKTYYISRNTIRQTLDMLEKENYIEKIKGKGSFVMSPKIYQNKTNCSKLYADMESVGLILKSQIINSVVDFPNEYIRNKLQLEENSKVFEIEWVRYANNEPLIYETVYLNYKYVEGIENFNLRNIKLYEILEKEYNINCIKGKDIFFPCKLDSKEAKYLMKKTGDIGMRVERILYHKNAVIEYTKSTVRGDKFIYGIEYEK